MLRKVHGRSGVRGVAWAEIIGRNSCSLRFIRPFEDNTCATPLILRTLRAFPFVRVTYDRFLTYGGAALGV